jgi:hypothetical protein
VAVEWTNSAEAFELSITAPPESPLRVALPVAGKVEVLEGSADVEANVLTSRSTPIKIIVRR